MKYIFLFFLVSMNLCVFAQTIIFSESFGTGGYYNGPANGYFGMDNPVSMYTDDTIIVQNYNPSDYVDASANSHIFVDVERPTFTIMNINTSEHTDCCLSFGTASWWGLPADFMIISYSTDGSTWTSINKSAVYEGEYTISPGGVAPWGWVKLSQVLPSTDSLQIKFTSINTEQGFFLDDIAISGISPDTEPPTQPSGLTASMVEPNSFLLTWNASTDNQGMSGYEVLQDGIVISSTASNSVYLQYLQPGSSSNYTIIAYDLSGNPSDPSTPINVSLPSYPVDHTYSWETPVAEVLPNGDLVWTPEDFQYEEGASVRYVDYEGGDDSKDGLTTTTAWKHHPWDDAASGNAAACIGIHTYVFKRGVVYRGTLNASESGEYGNPVRLTSSPDWGTGEACIYGSTRITGGWLQANSTIAPDIPTADLVWDQDLSGFDNTKTICEISGNEIKRVRVARIPNYSHTPDEPMKDWWSFTQKQAQEGQLHLSDTRNLVHVDPDFYSGGDVWATEDVVVMCTLWKQKILNYVPAENKIVVSSTDFGGVDCKYYIENTPFLLDTTGEFYYDNSIDRLFLRLDDDKDPNTTIIEIASESQLIHINSKSNIVISGLTFGFTTYNNVRYGTGDGVPTIKLEGSCSSIEIKNCKFMYVNGGILATGSSNANNPVRDITISDNEMNFMDDFSILMNSSGGFYLHDINILRNKIFENGTRHLGRWYSAIPAIDCKLISGEIAGNIIEYSWGGGIILFWGKGSGSSLDIPYVRGFVHHNKVSHSLIGVNDYGGIESWQGGPAFLYNNISFDASGYKYNWDVSLGYPFYLDGTFKNAVFNNIAYGKGWNKSHGAYMQVLGYYNIYAHNNAYNSESLTFSGDGNLSIDGQNIYLSNVSDSTKYQFNHSTKPAGMPFESIGYNVFSGRPYFRAKVVSGSTKKDFDAFTEEVNSYNPDLGQIGYFASKRVFADPSSADFRLHAQSEAIDRGVKFFLPFPLSKVVGEWHFYKHNADSTLIKADNFYFTSDFNDRETYNNVPKNHMTAHGLSDTSFVNGDLEDWTVGALAFNGSNTYCSLSHTEASSWKSNDVDITTDNFILEVYLKTAAGHTGGVVISKFESSGTGYQLDINNSGQIRIGLMDNGTTGFSLSSSTMINDGEWHHILTEVNRQGAINIYVDGVLDNGLTEGAMPLPSYSLSNEADLLIGKNKNGNYFEGVLDFVRISKGLLMDARTTIDELYKWETDGPFLYDMAGNAPIEKRDAGALEFGTKLCDMTIDPNTLEFDLLGNTLTSVIVAEEGFEIMDQVGTFFTYELNENEMDVTAPEYDLYDLQEGYLRVFGCNETQRIQVIQTGAPCLYKSEIPDTIFFGFEGGEQYFKFITNGKYEILEDGNLSLTIKQNESNDSIIFQAGTNTATFDRSTLCTISGCSGVLQVFVVQKSQSSSVNSFNVKGIRIWPNPVPESLLNIHIPDESGKCRIMVTDITGAIHYQKYIFPGNNQFDIQLKQGIYFLRINISEAYYSTKIIVM